LTLGGERLWKRRPFWGAVEEGVTAPVFYPTLLIIAGLFRLKQMTERPPTI
jgi:hypothetical protein